VSNKLLQQATSRRFRQLCCRFGRPKNSNKVSPFSDNSVAVSGNFVAVSGDHSRRKRQQSVAVFRQQLNSVAVSGNCYFVAVFGDYIASATICCRFRQLCC